MSKNIVIVNGSPRKNGNTEILVDAFIEGAKESGNAITKFNVGAMKINGCTDCQYCFSHPGECVQKDGMKYTALYIMLICWYWQALFTVLGCRHN